MGIGKAPRWWAMGAELESCEDDEDSADKDRGDIDNEVGEEEMGIDLVSASIGIRGMLAGVSGWLRFVIPEFMAASIGNGGGAFKAPIGDHCSPGNTGWGHKECGNAGLYQ